MLEESKIAKHIYSKEAVDQHTSPLFEQSVHNSLEIKGGLGQDDMIPEQPTMCILAVQ